MIYKRIISAAAAIGIFAGLFSASGIVNAGETDLTKEVYINVAQNKPIEGGRWSDTYPITNLVDGSRMSFIVPDGTYTDNADGEVSADEDFWFTVDLLHRYNVDRIELYDRYNTQDEGGRRSFKIYGANNADFSDQVELGGMDDADDNVFPDNGPFAIDLDGVKAYRYIKFQRTGGYYYGYSEFKVFAKQTVTEVSRNKNVTASEDYVGSSGVTFYAENAVNGTNSSSSDSWVGGAGKYNYLQIDLDSPMHIGYVEAEGRSGGADFSDNRINVSFYGSQSGVPEDIDVSVPWTVNGTKLTGVKETGHYVDFLFKPYPEMYASAVNDSEAYRYIIYKKEDTRQAAAGEIRAFVINPKVVESEVNGSTAKLIFSDEMDPITASNISVKNISGGEVECLWYNEINANGPEN